MTSSENRATIPTGQHNIMCPCIMCHRLSPKSRYRVARFATINARLIARFQHLRAKEIGIVTRDFVCEMVQFFCNVA